MTDRRRGLQDEAAPPQPRRRRWSLLFAVAGGPLAWFVQLNANYGLFAQPCYPGPDRNIALPSHSLWVWPLSIVIYVVCLAAALGSFVVALGIFRAAQRGEPEERDSRDCFIGYSGILLGGGFAVVIFANLIALIAVPACAL